MATKSKKAGKTSKTSTSKTGSKRSNFGLRGIAPEIWGLKLH